MLSRLLHHAPTKRLLLVAALLVAAIVLMIRLRISPTSFISISAVTAVAVLIFQTLLQNVMTGLIIVAQDRYPVGSRLAVENVTGTVLAHHLLSLTIANDAGGIADCPWTKCTVDIIIRDPPKPNVLPKE